jgi:succinate dehydrogenase/fumarate reductase flavoprotein subunit
MMHEANCDDADHANDAVGADCAPNVAATGVAAPVPDGIASEARPLAPIRADDAGVPDRVVDVIVVGFGAAGASAAIEAAAAGAETLVLERATRGGGATALSGGLVYLGGGTRVQRACGHDDTPEEMEKHVRLAAGAQPDPEKLHAYCAGSLEHFDWLCAQGVEFKDSEYPEKVTHPPTDDCLLYTGNEQAHPFAAHARPAPRGHKPMRPGDAGGYLMEVLMAAAVRAGAEVRGDARAEALCVDPEGRVTGVRVRGDRGVRRIDARRGVVLATGGFIMNRAMVERHAPELTRCNYPLGTEGDDGWGIRVGQGAGGAVDNMHEGLVLNAFYPPESHLKGVMVNARGERFINEDAYIGRVSDAILYAQGGRAHLVVDDAIYGPTPAMHRVAAVGETFEALERELALPPGALVATLERYNAQAQRGLDADHHKAARYLRPLASPPFAALDCSTRGSIYGVFTFGGLVTNADGEVLGEDRHPVPGLYAAGRCTAGLPREGRTYASGLSIGDASFFGRRAGRAAARGVRAGAT